MKEKIDKITDEYGQLHEKGCALNNENGSDDGCDCSLKTMIEEVVRTVVEYISYDNSKSEDDRKCTVKMYMDSWVPFKEELSDSK